MSSFTLVMGAAGQGVPIGAYQAEFSGVEPVAAGEFGPGLCWKFRILRGAYTGKFAQRITQEKPTLANACGKMVTAIAGQAMAEGSPFEVAHYIGKHYTIVVVAGARGGTRVETVAPLMS